MEHSGGEIVTKFRELWSLSDDDLEQDLIRMEYFNNKKVWHQLTLHLLTMFQKPSMRVDKRKLELYQNFIASIEYKVDPLSLMRLVEHIVPPASAEKPAGSILESQDALAFLDKIEPKIKNHPEAVILSKIRRGRILLLSLQDKDAAKKVVEETEVLLNALDGITSVHAPFYLLVSDLARIDADHAAYYRSALRYLGCLKDEEWKALETADKEERALHLSLAALLGEGIYNFGELLAHPILESLKSTSNAWVGDLLLAFNSGDITCFEKLMPQIQSQPDLSRFLLSLRQKICLLCLMEMTFKRPALNRQLSFADIAAETKLPEPEVELLVMKALSLGLVNGTIDQVASKVNLTWVQARVLDRSQMQTLITRLDKWCSDIKHMEIMMEGQAKEIIAHT
ncbi:unnamed protein product [Cyprideis torosa]|uniref:26S proteasome non-ATPase regulatory subunit 13 n=1 Tax=Cyprideis torosa TaxID=163714 RepID=A0A7R8ZM74_9CRUS|nr:unnamed protein product [Cyprideis torosa]CAG0894898.1 unnamed protein product [Cyprideis torosa]